MGCPPLRKTQSSDGAQKYWEQIQQKIIKELNEPIVDKEENQQDKSSELKEQEKIIQQNQEQNQFSENLENLNQKTTQIVERKEQRISKLEITNLNSLSISLTKRQKKLDISKQEINQKIMVIKKEETQNIVQKSQEEEKIINQDIEIQQKEVYQIDNNCLKQNNQLEIQQNKNTSDIQDEVIQQIQDDIPQSINEENILKRCFMIDSKQLKIGKLSAQFLNKIKVITSDIILDEIIYKVINTTQIMYSQRVTWLIKVLINLSECKIQQQNAIFYDGQISKELLMKLINAILDKIVSAVARPQKLEWVNDREDINKFNSEDNQIASQVYDMMFGQQILDSLDVSNDNLDYPALNYLLTYLDTKCQTQDSLRFLELITKRELFKCQKVNLKDCANQERALQLLNKLSLYPKLTELLLENSWAFGKFQQFTTGRDIQKYSIFGSILCLSTFPRDFPEVKSIFGNQAQSLQMHQICYRGPIYDLINKMADIFLRIIRRGKQAQLQLFTFVSKLIEINLDIEKVTQKEKYEKCCFQGLMFNLQQVLLEIFNPFIYNNEQANAKVNKINKDLLAYIKDHPLLAKIYQNVNQMAPLKTVFKPLDKYPDVDPMTFLYLLIQKINSLQQHMIIDYVLAYVFLQYDKKHFGSNSKFTQESEVDKATYDTLLLHPKSVQNTIQFLSFQSKVALSLLDENCQPKYPYGLLSNQFMHDSFNYCFIYNSNDLALDYLDEIISICELTIITMKYNDLIEDIHLRVQGMELFYIFNDYVSQKNNAAAEKSYKIFAENKIIKDYLIEGLIKAYVDHDRVKVSNILPPLRFKSAISQLFTYILTTHKQIYEKKFLWYIKVNTKTYQSFAYVYINDIKEMVDQCITQTKKIKENEDNESNQPAMNQALLPIQEKFIKQILKQIAEKKCIFDWKGVTELFQNLIIFTKIEPQAFLIEETRQQFVQNLNYVLEQLNGQQNDFLNSKFFTNYDVQPKELSIKIIEIFINLKSQTVFWDEIIMNNQSLQIDMLHQLINKLSYQKTIPEQQLQEFFKVLDNLDLLRHDFDQIMNDLLKDPNKERKYLDSLTRNLMSDPVMLPNSKQILDRVTIKRLLIKKQEDPFDRSFLSEDMLVEQKELKQEIKQYIESKKQEMRLLRQSKSKYQN
ncbi:unnamed protein product [Paramecium sonneborni]|uniref:RING-type E3 ubiquitin transferase n=2 Tax=Paramecium sonneborni TaxID=65129 RepID=A0A8S1RE32_9CILI|nr:unnamed protein product [Paramecium sonneborni]